MGQPSLVIVAGTNGSGKTTFAASCSDKFLPIVAAAKNRRFRTRLIFIALPTVELALDRIRSRVAQGGHDVPEDKVRSRWVSAHDNLVAFNKVVDDVFVFANLGTQPIAVAERNGRAKLRLIDRDALPDVTVRLDRVR